MTMTTNHHHHDRHSDKKYVFLYTKETILNFKSQDQTQLISIYTEKLSDLSEARSFVSFFLAPEIKKSHVPTLGLYLEFPSPGGKKKQVEAAARIRREIKSAKKVK